MNTEKGIPAKLFLSSDRRVNSILILKGTSYSFITERLMGGWGSGGSRVTTVIYENGITELIFHRGAFSFEEKSNL